MPNTSRGDDAQASALPPSTFQSTPSAASNSDRLPVGIYVIAVVSLLNDVATEMVTPLIPLLLATVLANGPLVLGLDEGLANTVACLAQVWADCNGRFLLLVPGWLFQSAVMLGFCFASSIVTLWIATLFFGVAMSVSEGVERAVTGDFADPAARGALFGWYYALVGMASIPAGLMLGWLWQTYDAAAICEFAGIVGLVAVGLLHFKVAPLLAKSSTIAQRP